jgi:predicted Zn-dependent protease
MSDKRLLFLEKMTQEGSKDPMAWYGLALEYRSRDRLDEALATFVQLRADHPNYVPMYLLCGEMLKKRAEDNPSDKASLAAAKSWLEAGIEEAKKAGNSHAVGELQSALDNLD